MQPNDICYETGEYTDECCCDLCTHREDCSGFEDDDEDDMYYEDYLEASIRG